MLFDIAPPLKRLAKEMDTGRESARQRGLWLSEIWLHLSGIIQRNSIPSHKSLINFCFPLVIELIEIGICLPGFAYAIYTWIEAYPNK